MYIFHYDFCLGEKQDWQHVPGIDDAAYSYYSPSKFPSGYQDAVDICQRFGGKLYEPTETTNDPVSKWANEKLEIEDKGYYGICSIE